MGGITAAEALKAQYASKRVSKEYLCLCGGIPPGPVGHVGEVTCKLRTAKVRHRVAPSAFGKEAQTCYEVAVHVQRTKTTYPKLYLN